MKFSTNIENHYAITVMDRQFDSLESLNQELLVEIENMEVKDRDSHRNAAKSADITTEGGFQTALANNFLDLQSAAVSQLKTKIILPAVKEYLNTVFGDSSKNITPHLVGWANILRRSDWQRPHMHPTHKNLVSGCYYVEVPEFEDDSEGHIEFMNPMPISVNHGFSNSRKIAPRQGKLLLFPPFYNHYVHPLKTDKKRVIIAFDVLPQAPGFNLVF